MPDLVEAILRGPCHGRSEFLPGMVFETSFETFKKQNVQGMFLFYMKEQPEVRLRVLPALFLPMGDYLQRQPARSFLALIKLQPFNDGDPNHFLTDPEHLLYSRQPFRFESIGELNYFMNEKHLNRRLFTISEFGKAWPT